MRYLDQLIENIRHVQCDTLAGRLSYDEMINHLVDLFTYLRDSRHMAYFVGNGGSAGIATHMTSDYLKNGGVATYSMYDPCTMTCLGNDFGYEHIFGKQLSCVAKPSDLLVAISSSGNSSNIVHAIQAARQRKCKVITLSGFEKGNAIRQMGDVNIYVPSTSYGMVESIHQIILQQVVDALSTKADRPCVAMGRIREGNIA